MSYQLQEGSTINVTCACCGKETFSVDVLQGSQEIRCSNTGGWRSSSTLVEFYKDRNGNISMDTRVTDS